MNDGTKKLIYAICGVAVVACIVYLLFDLNVFGGNDEENNNPPVANETKEPEPTPVEEYSTLRFKKGAGRSKLSPKSK